MATTFRYLNMAQLFSCLCTPQEWGGGGRRQTDLALWVWTMAGEIWAPSCTIRLRFLLPCFCHILVLHHSSCSCSGTELSWPSVWGEGEEEEWDSQSLCPRGHCLCQYWRPRNSKHLAREQIMSQRRSLIRSSSRVPCWLTSKWHLGPANCILYPNFLFNWTGRTHYLRYSSYELFWHQINLHFLETNWNCHVETLFKARLAHNP